MPLDIIIVGAGVAGLAAAVALAPDGHRIRIFEKAPSFEHEGFGMLVIPSATKILHDWQLDNDILDPFQPDTLFMRSISDTSLISERDIVLERKEMGIEHPAVVVDRSDLHAALYAKIADAQNVKLHLGVTVTAVTSGRVHFEKGSANADLVVASDGIHSTAFRSFPKLTIPEYIAVPRRLPVRFNNCVLDPDECTKNSAVAALFNRMSYWDAGKGAGAFVDDSFQSIPDTPNRPKETSSGTGHIFLPVRGKKMISVNSFRQESSAEFDTGPWTTTISAEQYMRDIQGDRLAESLRTTLGAGRLTERWTLGIRDCPTTFVQGRIVLIGDAAHPLNPSIGAGSGLGSECDAAVLMQSRTAHASALYLPPRGGAI